MAKYKSKFTGAQLDSRMDAVPKKLDITTYNKQRTEYNLSVEYPTSGYKEDGSEGGPYYDLARAVSVVNTQLGGEVRLGCKIIFYTDASNYLRYEYKGGTISDVANWDKGVNGVAIDYDSLTEEQKASLKGDDFKYEDFTEEQLAALKGKDADIDGCNAAIENANEATDKANEAAEQVYLTRQEVTDAEVTLNVVGGVNYVLTSDAITSITLTSVANSIKESRLIFSTGTTAPTFSMPTTVKTAGDWTIAASKSYEISIQDNLAVIGEYE